MDAAASEFIENKEECDKQTPQGEREVNTSNDSQVQEVKKQISFATNTNSQIMKQVQFREVHRQDQSSVSVPMLTISGDENKRISHLKSLLNTEVVLPTYSFVHSILSYDSPRLNFLLMAIVQVQERVQRGDLLPEALVRALEDSPYDKNRGY